VKKIFISFLLILFSSNLFANVAFFKGSWLCIEEEAAGFNWDRSNLKWKPVSNFVINKYIFKTYEDSDCYNFLNNGSNVCAELYYFGENGIIETEYDVYERDEYRNYSYIKGGNFMGEFKMSEYGDFIYNYNTLGELGNGSIIEDMDNYKDSMRISVGRCSKI